MKRRFIIDVIAGARPNFMKVAALFSIRKSFPKLKLRLIHTGQHYDSFMSDIFLKEFGLPKPTKSLEVGSATHAIQTAEIMKRYEKWITSNRPDLCIVVGDVNSTIACALAAVKMGVKVAHVEAGLRSFDRRMPEEINRVLTDSISHLHFITEHSGRINLLNEGQKSASIHLVGNVMIDTLLRMKKKADQIKHYQKLHLSPGEYAYVTLHRPSNVDTIQKLSQVIKQIGWLSKRMPVVFPIHPRTRKNLKRFQTYKATIKNKKIILTNPLGYLNSISVMSNAAMVVTDSGGIQEETTALKIPCLTLRENTERPITVEKGTNTLIKNNWTLYQKCVRQIEKNTYKKNIRKIPYWDGKSGNRILAICQKYLQKKL